MTTLHPRGVNHIAIATLDMKSQLEFWCDVLGMPLKGLFWLHGSERVYHAFVEMTPNSYISLTQDPNNRSDVEIGYTHSGNPAGNSAVGVVGHIAMDVASLDEVLALRDRIRSRGIQVLGPIDHGWWKSIYFPGPDKLSLEISVGGNIQPENWVDPEVVALCGISATELEKLENPAAFDTSGPPVSQPAYDQSKPTFHMSESDIFGAGMKMSDEEVWETFSYPEPPVPNK
jgi:catechol 2,3-dioxygenase-like lactoylglutathione lyase family enzyme